MLASALASPADKASVQVEYFYRIHDPTTPNQQGNDRGTQYRSAIFYHDDEQKRIAEVLFLALPVPILCVCDGVNELRWGRDAGVGPMG